MVSIVYAVSCSDIQLHGFLMTKLQLYVKMIMHACINNQGYGLRRRLHITLLNIRIVLTIYRVHDRDHILF